ncbi:hypothetical protein PTKIN_Ptkin02bG0109100 [Pterospermum kingtungense]
MSEMALDLAVPVRSLKPLISNSIFGQAALGLGTTFYLKASASKMASAKAETNKNCVRGKTIDSHLHIWASPQEAADTYPYAPGQNPTLPGHLDFLLQYMEEASVDGALIVQPIHHKFDHSLLTSVLKKHPTKFVGCCLANPAEDGIGVKQLEGLILKDGYRAVRFNPYLWPSGQEVYVKFSALFRVSRLSFPYQDLVPLLAEVVSSFGANRVMWGSDFPFVVPECGYQGAKEAASLIASETSLSSSEVEWIMGKTVMQLFQGQWLP